MENVDELRKIHCQLCRGIYSDGSNISIYNKCKHHMCESCSAYDYDEYCGYQCQFCGYQSWDVTQFKFHQEVIPLLRVFESSVEFSEKVEEHLRNKIHTLEQERAQWQALLEDHQKCSECETTDSEKNMQLCATCYGLKFKDIEGVKECALCPACAIKKHLRKGHHTVDLYPYFSAYNFSSHSLKIESQSEEVKNARDTLNDTVSRFNALSTDASENYDVLTDMARRSKSTKNQMEFIEKMKTFSNETKYIHTRADSELKERTEFLKDSVTRVKEWCNARMDNCVDDFETIKLETSTDSDNKHVA